MVPIARGAGTNLTRDGSYWERVLGCYPRGSWVRFPIMHGPDLRPMCALMHNEGYRVMGVFDSLSFENNYGYESFRRHTREHLSWYADSLDAIQAGNEWDHESESSSTMSRQQLQYLLAATYEARGHIGRTNDLPIVLGGAVSGAPGKFEEISDVAHAYCDAIAVHPYGQRAYPEKPAPAGDFGYVGYLISQYRRHTDLPILVTEFGVSIDEVGEPAQAEYLADMHAALHSLDVPVAIQFCMHPYLGFGLLRSNGARRPSFDAVRDVVVSLAYPSEGEDTVPTYQYLFGIADKARELGRDVVGEPLENEHDADRDGHAVAHQLTTNGEFVHYREYNVTRFIRGR